MKSKRYHTGALAAMLLIVGSIGMAAGTRTESALEKQFSGKMTSLFGKEEANTLAKLLAPYYQWMEGPQYECWSPFEGLEGNNVDLLRILSLDAQQVFFQMRYVTSVKCIETRHPGVWADLRGELFRDAP